MVSLSVPNFFRAVFTAAKTSSAALQENQEGPSWFLDNKNLQFLSNAEPCVDFYVRANTREKGGVQTNGDEIGVGEDRNSEGKQESIGGL